jgi:MFS family permease
MDTALTPAHRVIGIASAIVLIALVGVGLSLTLPLLSLEMERMGVSSTGIGFNTAIAGVSSILAIPFVPRLAARVGIGRLLAAAIAVTIGMLLLFKATYDFWLWFPIRFAFSAALGTLFVLSEYWITALAPPARRGLVMGLYATVLALGFAAGPAVLAGVGASGWPPYLAGGAIIGLAALPLLLARGHLPKLEHAPPKPFAAYVFAVPVVTAAAMAFGAIETGGFAILPIYGLRTGFDAESAALLVSVLALGNVALQLPLGMLADKVDKRMLLIVIATLGAAGAAALPYVAGPNTAFHAVLFIWGGLLGGLYTVGLAHLASRFSGADVAGANAAFVVLYNVGLTTGPPVVGLAMDLANPHGFAFALAALALIVPAAALIRR